MDEEIKKDEEEITYPIKISKKLWDEFKAKVPKTFTMNEAVIEAIKAYKEDKKEVQ